MMLAMSKGTRWPVRAGRLRFALLQRGNDMYPTFNMMTNNSNWDKGWFYIQNDGTGLPTNTGKVLTDCLLNWVFGLLDSGQQKKLDPFQNALRT
jgi:hypothetical protein